MASSSSGRRSSIGTPARFQCSRARRDTSSHASTSSGSSVSSPSRRSPASAGALPSVEIATSHPACAPRRRDRPSRSADRPRRSRTRDARPRRHGPPGSPRAARRRRRTRRRRDQPVRTGAARSGRMQRRRPATTSGATTVTSAPAASKLSIFEAPTGPAPTTTTLRPASFRKVGKRPAVTSGQPPRRRRRRPIGRRGPGPRASPGCGRDFPRSSPDRCGRGRPDSTAPRTDPRRR